VTAWAKVVGAPRRCSAITRASPASSLGLTRVQQRKLIAIVHEHWADAGHLLRFWARSSQHDEELRAWWARALRLGASPTAAVMWLELMADADLRPVLPRIRVPTLVVHRRGDVIVPVGHARHMAELVPDAKYVELPGDDHLWFVGDQAALVEAFERYLTRPT
jgi:pimeloyl-ACP methyl ester carboxylesterase